MPSPEEGEDKQGPLEKGKEREAHRKGPMPCLVAKEVHPKNAACAAAQKGQEKKGGFRDTVFVRPGTAFVHAHDDKENKAHDPHGKQKTPGKQRRQGDSSFLQLWL